MRLHLRTRLSLSFAFVTILLAALATVVGVRFIDEIVRQRVQARIQYDSRIAWIMLQNEPTRVEDSFSRSINRAEVLVKVRTGAVAEAQAVLEKARGAAGLDYVALTDRRGQVIARGQAPYAQGDDLSGDPCVAEGLAKGQAITSFEILPIERLQREGESLQRAALPGPDETPGGAEPGAESGMALQTVLPLRNEEGIVVGSVIGGLMLNRNYALVDRIRDVVFGQEMHEDKEIGTVTISQGDLRVATNLRKPDGSRAIGTRISAEVRDEVIENGRTWHGRSLVADEWHVAAYQPIGNHAGKAIGTLYVGVLDRKYAHLQRDLTLMLLGIMLGGLVLVLGLGLLIARWLSGPMQVLAEEATVISEGKFDARATEREGIVEASDLARSLNVMAKGLQEREQQVRTAAEDLQRSNEALQRANRSYLEMLGFVGHEMKDPLGAAAYSAKSLMDGQGGPLDEKQKRLLDGVCRNVDYAVSVVRNFLDLSRIERGELRVQKTQVKLRDEVIEPVLRELSGAAAERGMKIVQKVPQDLALTADSGLLRIVYQNLVSNAIKFGKQQGLIELRGRREEGRIVLSVFNEGPGVPKDQRAKLFQKFTRLHDSMLPGTKGTGLGLYIAKDIAMRHGGDMWMEGEEGKSISVLFSIPIRAPADRKDPAASAIRQPGDRKDSGASGVR